VTVRLYDTQVQLRDFAPQDPANVTMYVCGPTVQSGPGIHHLRAALAFDLLRRWLVRRFGRVTFVRNVTDIDDKVSQNATADEPWWALAYRVEREFAPRMPRSASSRRPTSRARPASIPQMQELIATLIERSRAYAAAGDVYFDVRSWSAYGELTHQSIDAMERRPTRTARQARPADFALWKGAKRRAGGCRVGESLGAGRPGWHIECSAMSRRYLGAVRHPRRRHRPALPAPRERAGAVACGGDAFAATGCTTAWSRSATRRCRSRSAIICSRSTCSPTATRSSCATRSARRTTARRSISPRHPSTRPRRPSSASERSSARRAGARHCGAAGGRRYPRGVRRR
jgi:hypothetical protein